MGVVDLWNIGRRNNDDLDYGDCGCRKHRAQYTKRSEEVQRDRELKMKSVLRKQEAVL
jgi:hypothetical protein